MKRMLVAAVACASLSLSCFAEPLTTAVTYQGELAQDGNLANGVFDLKFRLYDFAIGGGSVGSEVTASGVSISNGRFTQSLDFGAGVFNGQRRWLEIDVRAVGGGAYTTLAPRQELTTAPYAAFAAGAASLNGQPASYYLNAGNLTGTINDAAISGAYSQPITLNNASNLFFGSGAGLSQLNASAISTGTINDARMPASVARTLANNTYTGTNLFQNSTTFNNSTLFMGTNVFTNVSRFNGAVGIGVDPTLPLDVSTNAVTAARIANLNTGIGTGLIVRSDGTGQSFGVRGILRNATGSTPAGGAAIFGDSDTGNGVAGFTGSTAEASAVMGFALASSGFAQGGTFQTLSTQGTALFARTFAATGTSFAVRGVCASPTGYSAYFEGGRNYFQNSLGVGTDNPLSLLHVAGTARVDSTLLVGGALQANGGIQMPNTNRTLAIDASAWRPSTSATGYSTFGGSGNTIVGTAAGASVAFKCPISVPEGAIITSITVYITDNSTNDISISAYRAIHTQQSSVATLATARTSSGASAAVRTLVWSPLTYTSTPGTESVLLSASWTVPATLDQIRLGNVVVGYTITSPLP
jgi:hypothetical protein